MVQLYKPQMLYTHSGACWIFKVTKTHRNSTTMFKRKAPQYYCYTYIVCILYNDLNSPDVLKIYSDAILNTSVITKKNKTTQHLTHQTIL